MGFLDGFLNKMNFSSGDEYDEDYDDTDMLDETDDEEYTASAKADTAAATEDTASDAAAGPAPFRKKAAKTPNSKVIQMQHGTSSAPKQSEVCMIIPKDYKNSNEIAEILLSGKTVVLNMEAMNIDAAQRVIDFTSGACYTMGGNLQKISKKIIIATPSNVELSGDFTELLKDEDPSDIGTYNLKV